MSGSEPARLGATAPVPPHQRGAPSLAAAARSERLPVTALQADLEQYAIPDDFDAVVAIGILMFFPREIARDLLARVQRAVRPGGCAAITVLVEGTTSTRPFDPDRHYLFAPGEVAGSFAGWDLLVREAGEGPAPDGTVRRFETVVARRPARV